MISFKAFLGILFVLLTAAIVVLGAIAYRYSTETVDASSMINHTHERIGNADEISSAFKDLLLEGNAFYIMSDTSRFHRYLGIRRELFDAVERMRHLAGNDVVQQRRIDSLDIMVKDLALFAGAGSPFFLEEMDVRKAVQARFDKSNILRERINGVLLSIREREKILLRSREGDYRESVASFNRTFVQLLAGMGILLALTFISIRYNFNKRIKTEEQLRLFQEETKNALAAEIELNKLKTNFVTMASHEFRTPLTTILSSAFLVEKHSFTLDHRDKVAKHLARIRSSVNYLTSVLDEFLLVTNIEEGKVRPNLERLNLKKYLQMCCAGLQRFMKPGQTIVFNHSGGDEVETDPVLLGSIINNLVTNAIKYSPENSSILVSSVVNSKLHLSVKDSGIGISQDDQKHLFNRFYRASNAGTVQGVGLGLHIMKHYVEMLNGTVTLKSEIGKGTEVEVIL